MHVFILSPNVVFRARMATPLFSDPTYVCNYDTLSIGSAAAVKPGMTVRFGSAAGASDYGRQRVTRPNLVGSSTTGSLYYGFSSTGSHDGEVTQVAGAWIEVLEEYRVWAKVPYIYTSGLDTIVLKDGFNNAVGNVEVPPPVANGGPGFAGTIDPVTHRLQHDFDGSHSWANDLTVSDGFAGVTAYQWNLGDGTLVSGTLTSATLRASFPAGFRYVSLTVTAYAKSHTCYVPVFARDPAADDCVPAQIVSHQIAREGQQLSLRLFDPLDRATHPDGTLVMVWEEDASATDGSRMIFVGWHQIDQNEVQNEERGTSAGSVLNCLDVGGRLATLPGFSQIVTNSVVKVVIAAPGAAVSVGTIPIEPLSAPIYGPATLTFTGSKTITVNSAPVGATTLTTSVNSYNLVEGDNAIYATDPREWFYTRYNNLLYYMWYLLYWHSSALEVADFLVYNMQLGASKFSVLSSDENTLAAQVNDLANIITPDHYLTCNRQGQLSIIPDPTLMDVSSRPGTVAAIFADSCSSFTFSDERPPKVARLITWATISDNYSVTAIKCIAPGFVYGQGTATQETTRRYAGDQFALNRCEGHRYARLNNRHARVTCVLPWGLIKGSIDPASMGLVALIVAETPRTYFPYVSPFSGTPNALGLATEISVSYEYSAQGTIETATVTWEEATSGIPAVTVPLDAGSSYFV